GGGQVRERALLRGDNLCRLTPQGCAALVEYGVRTIIDLRFPSELRSAPHPFREPGARSEWPVYLNLPLLDEADAPGMGALRDLNSPGQFYPFTLAKYPGLMAAVFRAIAAAAPGGVLIHCHAGKDRTGLVSMLLLALVEVPDSLIAEDYSASDRFLQPLYEELLAGAAHDPVRRERLTRDLVCPPETVYETLRFRDDAYGGARAYLESAGVAEQDLQAIRSRLGASEQC